MIDKMKLPARMQKRNCLRHRLANVAVASTILVSIGNAVAPGAQAADAKQACRADYQSFCADVEPGGGRVIACLKKNAEKLSPDCRQALSMKNGG